MAEPRAPRTCPDRPTLHALFDGELPGDDVLELDVHVRDCATCRDFLRSLAVVDRSVRRAGPSEALSDAYEDQFLGGLMERMVTSDEVSRWRRLARTWQLAAGVAAAALIAIVVGRFVGKAPTSADDTVNPVGTAASMTQSGNATSRRGSLERFRQALSRLGKAANPSLDSFMSQWDPRLRETVGRPLEQVVEEGLRDDDVEVVRGSLRMTKLRMHHLADLRRILVRDDIDHDLRRATWVAVARISGDASGRLLAHEIVSGRLSRDDLVAVVRETGSEDVWIDLIDVVAMRVPEALEHMTPPDDLVDEHELTRRLLEAFVNNEQSGRLRSALLHRDGVAKAARRIAFSDRPATVRGRAISLLGACRDEGSVVELAALLDATKPTTARPVLVALADIGTPDAVLRIVAKLDVRAAGTVEANDFQRRLLLALRRVNGEVATKLIDRVTMATSTQACRLLIAAGCVGDEATIPRLISCPVRDDLRWAVARAIGLIGGVEANKFLESLRNDRDARVRDEVRRFLDRRDEPQVGDEENDGKNDASKSVRPRPDYV